MIELLLPYGFDTLEYSRLKATIGICMLADYSVAMERQQSHRSMKNSAPMFHGPDAPECTT
jgi:hypothetical protein